MEGLDLTMTNRPQPGDERKAFIRRRDTEILIIGNGILVKRKNKLFIWVPHF